MKPSLLSAASCALLLPQGLASVIDSPRDLDQVKDTRDLVPLQDRATPKGPDGYAPGSVSCPSTRPSIRDSSKSALSSQEKEWLPRRRKQTISPIQDLLKRIAIPSFDSDSYLRNVNASSDALPNIGIAVSGGGYRALLNGAGAIAAFDSRSDGSTSKGNLGGLLQSATYLSGLSGGGWLVGSIYTNNFTTVHDSVNSKRIWQFDQNILEGPEDVHLLDYYTTIIKEVDDKHDAGFDRSITDYWGRMLSYQLVDAEDGGPAYTFSSIADDPDFSSAGAPMPILVSDSRAPGKKNTTLSDTLFEINPWEIGSFDTTLQGFAPLRYAGSNFSDGKLPSDEKCIEGFDNAGYIMGTSSTLFNQIVLQINGTQAQSILNGVPKFLVDELVKILTDLGKDSNDIAAWTPNPFRGFNKDFDSNDSNQLTLVDGGEDGENIPFHPHTVTDRKVDVIFAVDSSADSEYSWPDGTSAMDTYRRSLLDIANGTSFPVVPGNSTFVNQGLNTRPTFFGCNTTNTTEPAPLVVYLPNYPYVFFSNTSTYTLGYNDSERDAMIENGWAVATQLNSTRDTNWDVCVGCAILHRSLERTKTDVPQACQRCFSQYCWNGTIDERKPDRPYEPKLFSDHPVNVTQGESAAGRMSAGASGVALISAAAMLLVFV